MNRPTGSTWFEIWHDMNSCCQFWMDGVEIIVLQLGPGQCNCLQCRSKLNDTTTSETCHFELSKKHHVASNLTAAWLINLWLTGEWFHAREMISRCKPQGKSDRLVAYRLENDSTQGKWSHDAASHKADLSKFIDYRSRLEVAGLFFTTLLLMRCSGSRLTSGIPSRCLVKSIQTIAPRGWKYGFGML